MKISAIFNTNWFEYNRRYHLTATLIPAVLFSFSTYISAETFGIRFIVDNNEISAISSQHDMNRHLHQFIAEINNIYITSEVKLKAEIVDITYSQMPTNDIASLLQQMKQKTGVFSDFMEKANDCRADFTVTIVPTLKLRNTNRRICGAANGSWNVQDMMSIEKAYAVVNPSCGSYAIAHELGHIMGLNHGIAMEKCFPKKKEGIPLTPYANGYAEGVCDGKPSPEKFGDIMTGGLIQFINGSPNGLNIFSNPRIRRPDCGTRGICGDPEIGDSARALNEHSKYFIKFQRPPLNSTNHHKIDCIK